MNTLQLKAFLQEQNVPEYLYTFGGLGNGECVGLEKAESGWNVYFSERGNKNGIRFYTREWEAIDDFLRLLKTQYYVYEGKDLKPHKVQLYQAKKSELKMVYEKAWSHTLYEVKGELLLSVVCGSVALWDVNLILNETEKEQYHNDPSSIDELAKNISTFRNKYQDRHIPIVD